MNKSPLFIISGATASGKTSLSIALAQKLIANNIPAEIINFDSLLFYKDLNIGTAKPSAQEKEGIAHHLIDICSIHEDMNASRFSVLAAKIIEQLHLKNTVPILVGGSAFYIRALIKGMYETTTISDETRSRVEDVLKMKGYHFVREELKRLDQESYTQLHENDEYRNVRAYEFHLQTGKPISEEKSKIEDPYDFSNSQYAHWDIFHIYLDIPREEHWPIMEKRTHEMLNSGLINEVKEIINRSDVSGDEKALQSIGYKETVEYIKHSKECDEEELIQRIYISTRQLSKSQKTFFKKIKPKHTFHPLLDKDKVLNEGLDFLRTYYKGEEG